MAEGIDLQDIDKVALSTAVTSGAGNPVGSATAPVSWSIDDTNLIILVVADDTLSAEAVTKGPLGTATVSATDANGLTDSIALAVVISAATGLTIVAGTPEAK